MQNDFDFIAIGDTVVDTFIRLEQAEDLWDADHTTEKLCMLFAAKIPYAFDEDIFAVGNAANAAVSAARLGVKSALVSNLGDGELSKKCLESLEENGVDNKFVKVNPGMKTNHHYVLWFHDERTILVKHEEYAYELPDIGEPKCIYVSSLKEGAFSMYEKIVAFLNEHPATKLVFQPGVFDIKLGKEKLKDIYAHAFLFFCNVQEAQKILETEEKDIKKLMKMMSDLGPKIVVITDGPNGSYAFDGNESWYMKIYPDPKPPYERTGAGDAFSSTFSASMIEGKSIPEAMERGSVNSMSVVQQIGAQKGLLHPQEIEEWLNKKPADWQAQKI